MALAHEQILKALEKGYLLALQMPDDSLRIRNQTVLAEMCTAIALARGVSSQVVQEEFEEKALEKKLANTTNVPFPNSPRNTWIPWDGGPPPVGAQVVVTVAYRMKLGKNPVTATGRCILINWRHTGGECDVMMYMVRS